MLKVFIGYDPRQPVSYTVLHTSIMTRSTMPVAITPLVIEQLPLKRQGLTPFTYSRFLVPWLCKFEGRALFLDADILAQGDIADLWDLAGTDMGKAVWVRQGPMKFEWASVMLFDCDHGDNRILTPEYIETAKGLHGIEWTKNIGELPQEWNHLVGYDAPIENPKFLHYTQGVPVWKETLGGGYANEWRTDLKVSTFSKPWEELMGKSVHAAPVRDRLAKQETELNALRQRFAR